jgi:hypothetical protein
VPDVAGSAQVVGVVVVALVVVVDRFVVVVDLALVVVERGGAVVDVVSVLAVSGGGVVVVVGSTTFTVKVRAWSSGADPAGRE